MPRRFGRIFDEIDRPHAQHPTYLLPLIIPDPAMEQKKTGERLTASKAAHATLDAGWQEHHEEKLTLILDSIRQCTAWGDFRMYFDPPVPTRVWMALQDLGYRIREIELKKRTVIEVGWDNELQDDETGRYRIFGNNYLRIPPKHDYSIHLTNHETDHHHPDSGGSEDPSGPGQHPS